MKTKGLKIINKKSQNTSIIYLPYKLSESIQCVGNWDQLAHFRYITISRKFYMTMNEYKKKETRRKYYKNKIKLI